MRRIATLLVLAMLATGAEPAMASAASATSATRAAPAPLPIPASVQLVEAQSYASGPEADPQRHLLDLYLPQGAKSFPTVVFAHGGGYQRGDRSVGRNLGVTLAARGVAVAAISYRLFPQARHPAQIQDLAKAFAWVRRGIAALGGDPARVFVSGHSAGGHLASLLGADPAYLAAEGLDLGAIAGVIALSGGYRINPIRKAVFGSEEAMAAASPFAHLGPGRPPFVLIYGELEKQDRHALSRELRDALIAAGGRAAVVAIPDRDHQGLLDRVGPGDAVAEAVIAAVTGR